MEFQRELVRAMQLVVAILGTCALVAMMILPDLRPIEVVGLLQAASVACGTLGLLALGREMLNR